MLRKWSNGDGGKQRRETQGAEIEYTTTCETIMCPTAWLEAWCLGEKQNWQSLGWISLHHLHFWYLHLLPTPFTSGYAVGLSSDSHITGRTIKGSMCLTEIIDTTACGTVTTRPTAWCSMLLHTFTSHLISWLTDNGRVYGPRLLDFL